MLLVGRVVQAVGTAIMMPLLMTTVLNVVPAERRGRTMGIISIVIAVAPAIGPTIGGVILDQLDWRWMFWLVLPIALRCARRSARLWIRNVTEPRASRSTCSRWCSPRSRFGGLVFGLSSIGEAAEGDALMPPWIPLAVGVVALAVFVCPPARSCGERRAAGPAHLPHRRRSRSPSLLVAISMMALFGTLILLPLYLQNVLGQSTARRPA